MDKKQERQDRLEEEQAAVLPAREAMSIITPDTTPFVPDLEAVQTPDGTEAAQQTASDAQGSSSGEESVTSDTRSEHITNQDTASSQT